MNVLFCSGEVYPFSKTGGLADVAYSLPKALNQLGHTVKIITPLYQKIQSMLEEMSFLGKSMIHMGDIDEEAKFYSIIYQGVNFIFVKHDDFFNRDHLYGYEDDAIRFTFFNFAVFEYIKISSEYPDVVHVNDWQTGLIPFLLDVRYRSFNPSFSRIKTLLSIHNLEKQGSYPLETEKLFGNKNFTYIHLDRVNFLKCGIMRANAINTVSENYKKEILTRFYGFSLDGPLKSRQYNLYGILNGLDQDLYNPKNNAFLFENYDENSFIHGKAYNKKMLLESLKLKLRNDVPVVTFINRFARQKGIDIMMTSLESFLKDEKFYFIAIGSGDAIYEMFFLEMQNKYPGHVYFHAGFNYELSQKVYAASDLFLLPSLFEPCGLNHMIAMRYGTLPIVRETGGLKDTVRAYDENSGIGTGFSFINYDANEMVTAINSALDTYNHHKEIWNELILQAMREKHSIIKMARQYEELYQMILND
ncbi:MAG: glycogen synthase [Firmicutes bacterium]|nr:glycogen synthase [Bacillota bacterium]